MKVAVITRHAITNYGSLLQALATQTVVEKMGHCCEIIDYIRDDEYYSQHEKTILKRKPEWNNNLIKRTLYLLLRQLESVLAGKRFEKAQRKYLKLTERYHTLEQLSNNIPSADVYMTGSDQVWGPTENGSYDSSYCLSFTKDTDKRIAYAASFGHTEMTAELKQYYRKWLSRYEYIAVREDSAVAMIKEFGMDAYQVVDPTLLLDASFWNNYLSPIKIENYVLVYQLHNDEKLGRYAKRVADEMNLPLIRISASFHQITREGKFVWCPEVGQFLSYIKNATCMITDSFHGTAFAINFNTPFVEVLPNNNTGTRNMSILRMTGLSQRILRDEEDIQLAKNRIDFTETNEVLKEKRTESLEILKKMIEE